jgi:predicted component of type VI protein secretion system
MAAMSPPPSSGPPGFSRRTLLAASAAGLAFLATGCTSSAADEREKVTSEQADELTAQVAVQETLVSAFVTAGAADPALAGEVADLAAQADEQLTRLRAAAPGSSRASSSSSSASGDVAPPAPATRAWLRAHVAAAATSHATACVDQSGARAALLGSIAAGLAGQDGRLA